MNYAAPEKSKKRWPVILALAVFILAAVLAALYFTGVFRLSGGDARVSKLRCVASQNVQPYGNDIVYYDGMTLYCLNSTGGEKWSYSLGGGADFDTSGASVAAWMENQLYIIDRSGRATYNDHLKGTVQFAKGGSRYVAAVVGDGFSPTVTVKDLAGITVDEESNAYTDKAVLDMGFFSGGEYLYISTLETYGTVAENTLYTIRVGQMNTGELSLGESLTAAVAYAAGKMYVISSKELKVCDYRGTVDTSATTLVYGWHLMDWAEGLNSAEMLFAPSRQVAEGGGITELRLIRGNSDTRLALPTACVGAAICKGQIYAFSEDTVYRAGYRDKRFTAIGMNVPGRVTGFKGMTEGGTALLCCGEEMYAVTLP